MQNNINLKSRPAMSYLTILATMVVVMIIIIVSTPVITRRMQHITQGRSSAGSININSARGFFMCYRDADGNLMQYRQERSATGAITQLGPTRVASCSFNIPTSAEKFNVTLIGGGGGGAGTSTEIEDTTIATDSLDFGVKVADFRLFNLNRDLITEQTAVNAVREFSKPTADGGGGLELAVVYSGATAKGTNKADGSFVIGQSGAICRLPIYDVLREHGTGRTISYSSGAAGTIDAKQRANDGRFNLTLEDGSTLSWFANGGRPPFWFNDAFISYSDCFNNKGGIACSRLLKAPALADERGIGRCCYTDDETCKWTVATNLAALNTDSNVLEVAGAAAHAVRRDGASYVDISSVPFSLKRAGINAYIAQSGGSAGSVVTNQASFLAPEGTTTLTIPAGNIGNGGAGGANNCNKANPNRCNGGNGGRTTLSLTTATGERITYSANGGSGAEIRNEVSTAVGTKAQMERPQVYSGFDGDNISYAIPVSSEALKRLSVGRGATACTADGDAALCAGGAATYPGSGGGSAAVALRLRDGGAPNIQSNLAGAFRFPDPGAARFDARSGAGGRGASGAIIIEW